MRGKFVFATIFIVILITMLGVTSNSRFTYAIGAPSEANKWMGIDTVSSPKPRTGHAMAFDTLQKTVVLFGGCDQNPHFGGNSLGDTWLFSFENNTWIEKNPSIAPLGREEHAMAYDSKNDKIVLFGGAIERPHGISLLNDTWVYDVKTNVWTEKAPSISPGSRFHHTLVYDSDLQKIILFGGCSEAGYVSDMWIYDAAANTWTLRSPSGPIPSVRRTAGAYDDHNRKFIIFGGANTWQLFDDTWAYDPMTNVWLQMHPPTCPAHRYGHSMVFDTTSNVTLLFGGLEPYGGYDGWSYERFHNDTWIYDFGIDAWTELSLDTAPSPRASYAMAFDSNLSMVWLLGGYSSSQPGNFDDTWAYGDPAVIHEFPSFFILPLLMIIALVVVSYKRALGFKEIRRRVHEVHISA
jgi:N-acetylneuraminic acid mutarotase